MKPSINKRPLKELPKLGGGRGGKLGLEPNIPTGLLAVHNHFIHPNMGPNNDFGLCVKAINGEGGSRQCTMSETDRGQGRNRKLQRGVLGDRRRVREREVKG